MSSFRSDLAYVTDQGYGFHAAACAPGILALLEPVRERGGLVLEIGCGTGLLTRFLVRAGHRVSPRMPRRRCSSSRGPQCRAPRTSGP